MISIGRWDHVVNMGAMSNRLVFQVLTCSEYDAVERTEDRRPERRCMITLTGRTSDGRAAMAICTGFRPSLVVMAGHAAEVHGLIADKLSWGGTVSERYTSCSTRLKQFVTFSRKQGTYERFSFTSVMDFMTVRKFLRASGVDVFNAALPPSQQMLAELCISPCQWVDMAGIQQKGPGNVSVIVSSHWQSLAGARDAPLSLAPFKVLAFDIECHSSHGDFPRAQKDYERTARELASLPNENLASSSNVRHLLERAFSTDSEGDPDISRVFTRSHASVNAIEAAAHAVSSTFQRGTSPQLQLGKRGGKDARSLVGAARVAAVLQSLKKCKLPPVLGDPIIQIGMSVRRVGDSAAQDVNHILVLGDCDPVVGAEVHTFATESQLLRRFLSLISTLGADFITGYNINNFDCSYIVERCAEQGIDPDTLAPHLYNSATVQAAVASCHSVDMRTKVVETKGSADRDETYFNIRGRVGFDLLNVVKKGHALPSYKLDAVAHHFTGERKDDVTPAQIFASHTGSPSARSVVASYCVQDCRLVLHLVDKLNVIPNTMGMADVCAVPPSWIFLRGQGVKTLALVSRQCRQDGFAVPELGREALTVSYEGATVLEPEIGAYIETPVVVLDFASLYPSSIISHNISHDTLVAEGDHGHAGSKTLEFTLDVHNTHTNKSECSGQTSATFVSASQQEGVLPRILQRLIAERKRVKRLISGEADAFRRATLDGLQLAYKVTANSLYGQLGAPTSPIFCPQLAAATTAVGRSMLMSLRNFAVQNTGAHVVYGDTDSVFLTWPAHKSISGLLDKVAAAVDAGKSCSKAYHEEYLIPEGLVNQNAEYEKVLFPLLLLSKKRYIANKYEASGDTPSRTSMGVVTKRRDNAQLLRHVYDGVVERVMAGDVGSATLFAREQLVQLVRGQVATKMLTISKTLRAEGAYVDPNKLPHVVLARRMRDREPGSEPAIGERVPYVHVQAPQGTLQADRVEHPEHIQGKKIDYIHYLENQLTRPLAQLFSVLIESIPGSRVTRASSAKDIAREVERLVFADARRVLETENKGVKSITSFFSPKV